MTQTDVFIVCTLQLRLHEQFFVLHRRCDFSKMLCRQHVAKICSHPHTGDSTTLYFCCKKFGTLNFSQFFSAIFSAGASPV